MKTKTIAVSTMALALFAAVVFAATVMKSPTACSGTWTNCNRAFADDTLRATGTTNSANGIWQNYGFNIPTGDVVDSVVVRADFFASKTSGLLRVSVSGNGGTSYGPTHTVGGNLAEQTFNIDVTGDNIWTPAKLNNVNFKVKADCVRNSSLKATCRLDWIPVTVVHHTPQNQTNQTCTRANPTVMIDPTSQSGSAGTTLAYTTTVINNDNNVCGSSTFSMSASIPVGWSSSFNPTSLLIAPGAFGTTQFNITSNVNATKTNYTFTNIATNTIAPSFFGVGSAIYNVI